MANAGDSYDNVLIHKLIQEGRTLPIKESDDPIAIQIKEKINRVILEDETSNRNYNGYKYVSHTAYNRTFKLVIKINRIRQRNWYYKKLE
jgi:hypothetical protein